MSNVVFISEDPGGIHYTLDRNGVILDIDENIVRLSGFKKEEIVGQNFRTFVNFLDQPALFVNFQNILNGMTISPCDFRIVTKDGEILVRTTAFATKNADLISGIEGTLAKI